MTSPRMSSSGCSNQETSPWPGCRHGLQRSWATSFSVFPDGGAERDDSSKAMDPRTPVANLTAASSKRKCSSNSWRPWRPSAIESSSHSWARVIDFRKRPIAPAFRTEASSFTFGGFEHWHDACRGDRRGEGQSRKRTGCGKGFEASRRCPASGRLPGAARRYRVHFLTSRSRNKKAGLLPGRKGTLMRGEFEPSIGLCELANGETRSPAAHEPGNGGS